jgi:predicted neuraminidase
MDHGTTWSEPKELIAGDHGGRGPVKNKNIVLADGTWLAPASLEGPKPGGKRRVWRAFVDISHDQVREAV